MGSSDVGFYDNLPPALPPPLPEDPVAQENKKKAAEAERGARGRASTVQTRTGLGDVNLFRRSLLGQ